MKKMKSLWIGLAILAAFALWTVLVHSIDVQAIGPNGSSVGFAALNKAVHETIGVHFEKGHSHFPRNRGAGKGLLWL